MSVILVIALKYVSWICKVELCDMVSPDVSGFCHKCCQSHKSLFGTALTLYFIVLYYFLLLLLVYYIVFLLLVTSSSRQEYNSITYNFATSTQHIFCNNIQKYKVWRARGNCYDIVNIFMDTFRLNPTFLLCKLNKCNWKLWNVLSWIHILIMNVELNSKQPKCIQLWFKRLSTPYAISSISYALKTSKNEVRTWKTLQAGKRHFLLS